MSRKVKHIIRGKTVKQWADILKVSIPLIYKLMREGQLEARIDGTWLPVKYGRPPTLQYGKTLAAWASEAHRDISTIRRWLRNGNLNRFANGQPLERGKPFVMVAGKTLREYQDELGVTRQRIHQLYKAGTLAARGNGTFVPAKHVGRKASPKTQERYSKIAELYEDGKSVAWLMNKFGVCRSVVYKAIGKGLAT